MTDVSDIGQSDLARPWNYSGSVRDHSHTGHGTGPIDDLRERIGIKTDVPNDRVAECYDAATSWMRRYTYDDCNEPEVYQAAMLISQRLYVRVNTAEGVTATSLTTGPLDPDVVLLLERHLDYKKWGIA